MLSTIFHMLPQQSCTSKKKLISYNIYTSRKNRSYIYRVFNALFRFAHRGIPRRKSWTFFSWQFLHLIPTPPSPSLLPVSLSLQTSIPRIAWSPWTYLPLPLASKETFKMFEDKKFLLKAKYEKREEKIQKYIFRELGIIGIAYLIHLLSS